MLRSISCLIFILTHSVLAQAAYEPRQDGTNGVNTQSWVTTYAGETEVDGLPVQANLDETRNGLEIPNVMASAQEVLVPSLMPVLKKNYRLSLIVSHNPGIRAIYSVQPSTVSIDGAFHMAYVSAAEDRRGFQFIAVPQTDGTIQVSYIRKVTEGNPITGQFTLSPLPHTLSK